MGKRKTAERADGERMSGGADSEEAKAPAGAPRDAAFAVVAIGNFDGVHLGHRKVLEQARAIGEARGLRCVVLTFDPHPRQVLGGHAPPSLTTLADRVELLEACVDEVVVEPFTPAFAAWSPTQFAEDLLVGRLRARAVVVGENFRFGQKRAGDFSVLRALGERLGFEAVAAHVAGDDRGPYSSTRIRRALEEGNVADATHVLGRRYVLTGVVERGDALGRTIGFPTANLGGIGEMLPKHGVYAVFVDVDGQRLPGAMNVGVRPTVGGVSLRVEVHLLDFAGDLYGKKLRVALVERVRDEAKFDGLDALKAQIGRDVDHARRILAAAAAATRSDGP